MSTTTQAQRNALNDPSLWLLFASNAATIFFALKEGWNLSSIMWVYWFQSIVIGFFNFIRILQLNEFSLDLSGAERPMIDSFPPVRRVIKIFLAFFFAIHYGGFHLGYFMFLLSGIFLRESESVVMPFDPLYILFAAIGFFISHLFSYLYNKPRDTKQQNIGQLMGYPYIRIFPMHLTIIVGTFSGGALLLFLLLKTAADCLMHIQHHYIKQGEG